MKNDPEIYKKAKGFDVHPENINRNGANKKIYTVVREMGYTPADVKTAFGEIAFYDKEQLEATANDNTKPAILVIIAKAFLKAIETSDYTKIREIMEQVIGKAVQTVDATINTESVILNVNKADADMLNELTDESRND